MVKADSKQENENQYAVTRRLDAMIRLLMDAQRTPDKKITKNDQIIALHSIGLTDTEIGKIIGQPRNEVASLRSKLRKANKK